MSAKRYSGSISIRVTYLDYVHTGRLNGEYRCFLRANNARCTIYVGVPASTLLPVDSPEAFDSAARAAIGFADHEFGDWGDWAEVDDTSKGGVGYVITRFNPHSFPPEDFFASK
jgi:hypothetical protein